MTNTPFETLLRSKHYNASERWYPGSVEYYRRAFKIDTSIENSRALLSNLAYSMQYLEFLEKEIAELKLSNASSSTLLSNATSFVFSPAELVIKIISPLN